MVCKNKIGQDTLCCSEELRAAIRQMSSNFVGRRRRSPIAAFGEFCKVIFVKHKDRRTPIAQTENPTFQRRDREEAEAAMRG